MYRKNCGLQQHLQAISYIFLLMIRVSNPRAWPASLKLTAVAVAGAASSVT